MSLMQQQAIDAYAAEMFTARPEVAEEIVWLDHNSIAANPEQPRHTFPPHEQHDLEKSIRAKGIERPLIVRRAPSRLDGQVLYQLVDGERRWRAAGAIELKLLPCIIRDMSARDAFLFGLRENVHALTLTAADNLAAVEYMRDKLGMSNKEILTALDKTEGWLTNYLSAINGPSFVRKMVLDLDKTVSFAPIIRSVHDEGQMRKMVRMVYDDPKTTAEKLRAEARRYRDEQEAKRMKYAPMPSSSHAAPAVPTQGTVPRSDYTPERQEPEAEPPTERPAPSFDVQEFAASIRPTTEIVMGNEEEDAGAFERWMEETATFLETAGALSEARREQARAAAREVLAALG